MQDKCWAYTENGTLCGQPAVAVDPERGFTVCEKHRPQESPSEARSVQNVLDHGVYICACPTQNLPPRPHDLHPLAKPILDGDGNFIRWQTPQETALDIGYYRFVSTSPETIRAKRAALKRQAAEQSERTRARIAALRARPAI